MKPKRARLYMLGDSMTEGDGGSYRYALFERLCRAGAAFEFLGENMDGDIRLPRAFRRHGGSCGALIGRDARQAGTLRGRLREPAGRQAAARADMILLWAGSDDCAQGLAADEVSACFEGLLDDIYSINPDVTIYAATLPDRDEAAREFNRLLLSRSGPGDAERGRRLKIVDMNRGERRLGRTPFPGGEESRQDEKQAATAWMSALGEDVLDLNRQGDPDYEAEKRVEALSADLRDMALHPGEGVTFHADAVPSEAANTAVLWYSSAPDVATVDEYGTVRAWAAGNALISATTLDGGFRALARLNVSGEPFDPGAGLVEALSQDEAALWTGETSVVQAGRFAWSRESVSGGLIARAGVLKGGLRTLLSFNYTTAGERTRSPERWVALRLGALEIRLSAGGMYAEVRERGESRERARLWPKLAVTESYALLRDGRSVTLYKSGEKLFACKTQTLPEDGVLEIEWHDFAHRNEISRLSYKTE